MKYEALQAPLTAKEMSEQVLSNGGYVRGVVVVELLQVVNASKDGDGGFYDLLSTRLTGTDLLQEISYRVVGHKQNWLHIEVQGDASGIEAGWPVELRRHAPECPARDGLGCRELKGCR